MRSMQPGAAFNPDLLLAPEAAIAAYLAAVRPSTLGQEDVPLAAAFGRILARNAVADGPYPAADRSTMDGFAVRAADGTLPRRITATIRMGAAPPGPVAAGEAMRIPTGGVLPPGADTVLPIEEADERDGILYARAEPAPRDYITPRGDDMAPGDCVLRTGRRIGAAELSVLATLGQAVVSVFRRPRVAVIPTGDELVDVERTPAAGQVRDSNRWAIAGGLAALGCAIVQLSRAEDETAAIAERIAEGLAAADAVVLTGGSSVGARDQVPAAIDRLGPPGVIVHGLKVKPGKPTVLAAVDGRPVIGLPGNPASALTIFSAIAAPLLRALTGETAARPARVATFAAQPFAGRAGWTWYVPAEFVAGGVRPLALRSAHTSLLARADGYVVVGPETSRIEAGAPVVLVRYGGMV
jgi:molybdenum cofactor synthesis domain-containing protein